MRMDVRAVTNGFRIRLQINKSLIFRFLSTAHNGAGAGGVTLPLPPVGRKASEQRRITIIKQQWNMRIVSLLIAIGVLCLIKPKNC